MELFGLLVLTFVVTGAIEAKVIERCDEGHSCKLEDLGCYNDHVKRALPEEILNERDPKSKVYGHRKIEWGNFKNYLAGFACRCAKIASDKGYTVIGLQFYGECWSGANAHDTYDMYGESNKCIGGDYKSISATRNKTLCNHHIGSSWTNHVYRINTPGCSNLLIEPIGCFHDDMIPPRPIPNYIMNERDYTDKSWNGKLIDWKNWRTYSPQMICRCAVAAAKRGDDYFSIQFWGECWSGKTNEVNYRRNGPSAKCVNEFFKPCECNSYNCVGMAHTNSVYRLRKKAYCTL